MSRVVNARNGKVLVNRLERARGILSRMQGLIGRQRLEAGDGLWIPRSGNSIHTCFMKFPIDVAFVNCGGIVKYLARDVKPWRLVIAPILFNTDCLELPAGTLQATETRKGDQLRVET
jgi:uncharacterized protein